jgi:hypothetical protein
VIDAPENDPQPSVPVLSYQNTLDQPRAPSAGRVIAAVLLCFPLVLTSVVFLWGLAAVIAMSSIDSQDALVVVLLLAALLYAILLLLRKISRMLGGQPPGRNQGY